jgi:SOS-response transcriptional repressor LexA
MRFKLGRDAMQRVRKRSLDRTVRSMEPAYTPKQGQYLAFIHHYTQVNGRLPAEADIQRFFRVSPPTVHQMILNLEAKGLLARTPGKPRSLRVLMQSGKLPELMSPGTPPQEHRAKGDAGAREVGTTKNRGPKAAQRSTPLQQLKDGETATLFRSLLAKHPELSAEAETLAASIVGDVAMGDVAQETEDAVRSLDIDDLNSRAGSHSYGYVEPSEAAWELIEEAVMPLVEDVQRRMDAGQPDAALTICAGVVLGLYRLRHDANDGCLGWAPDAPAEMAGEAVSVLRKALRKTGAPRIAGQSCDTLPTLLHDAAPEWIDMLVRCWRKPS